VTKDSAAAQKLRLWAAILWRRKLTRICGWSRLLSIIAVMVQTLLEVPNAFAEPFAGTCQATRTKQQQNNNRDDQPVDRT